MRATTRVEACPVSSPSQEALTAGQRQQAAIADAPRRVETSPGIREARRRRRSRLRASRGTMRNRSNLTRQILVPAITRANALAGFARQRPPTPERELEGGGPWGNHGFPHPQTPSLAYRARPCHTLRGDVCLPPVRRGESVTEPVLLGPAVVRLEDAQRRCGDGAQGRHGCSSSTSWGTRASPSSSTQKTSAACSRRTTAAFAPSSSDLEARSRSS